MYFYYEKLLLCIGRLKQLSMFQIVQLCFIVSHVQEDKMETDLEQYKLYVFGRYGKAAVASDGYSVEACTKDHRHMRRAGGKVETVVPFILSMTLRTKKEEFLSNHDSKQRFTAICFPKG